MHQRKQNHKKSRSPIPLLFRPIRTFFRRATRGLMRSLSRNMRGMDRRDRRRVAGFVLPTVTMVLLVVVLLSVAILFRSMERAKYAQYSRVDEATLQAATPALQRAKSKLQALFNDPTLPTRGTPTESALYTALSRSGAYTLPDEVPLEVRYDIDGGGIAEPDSSTPLEEWEKIQTAWKFPIDTDNDGLYDTWTLYGIYFRSPSRDADGNFNRERTPLDARTPPRSSTAALNSACASQGVGTLVGDLGWYSAGSNLKKSFFTYVANVPISQDDIDNLNSVYDSGDFQVKPGTSGFSALEYQQDLLRIPLNNSAVVYRDDLAFAPGGFPFRLNGRILTNSNLIVTQFAGLDFFLVSDPDSCYYTEENSKILVGGNLISGAIGGNADGNDVGVHLFQGVGNAPDTGEEITSGNDSTTSDVLDALDNALAFEERLDSAVAAAYADPNADLQAYFKIDDATQLENAVRTYFEDRTRRVPFAEVDFGDTAGNVALQGNLDPNENLRAQNAFIYPTNVDGTVDMGGSNNSVALERTRPPAQDPETVDTEPEIGNRILTGNALPAVWYNSITGEQGETQELDGVTWTGSAATRTRQSRIQELPDVGATGRDGFWERAAGIEPTTPFDNVGGLRVVTGAGVYDRINSFLPPPKLESNGTQVIVGTYDDPGTGDVEEYVVVWPDTMPMSVPDANGVKVFQNDGLYDATTFAPVDPPTGIGDAGDGNRWLSPGDTDYPADLRDPDAPLTKGDLKMRATVVYHYAANDDSNYTKEDEADQSAANYWSNVTQKPIACVSSYYDPSTSETAQNSSMSDNGIVYGPPTSTSADIGTLTAGTNGLLSGSGVAGQLATQANMVFPNGRFANETLRDALQKAANERTLSEQSAIDATLCSLGILGDVALGTAPSGLPNEAIYETSFLDAREIKQNEVTPAGNDYDMPLEYRQPLEVRATVLDLDQLRRSTIAQSTDGPSDGGNEYYLPYSGIIFASRDDALADSTGDSVYDSATDFILDPTRRPNGIMLVNGECLQRDTGGSCQPGGTVTEESITQEKGLTLATNLPVYVKGQFNLHTQEEFADNLADDWGNFYTRGNINTNFACRAGDPRLNGCNTGDDWRVANILSDAITVLSGDIDDQSTGFRFGYRNEGSFDLNYYEYVDPDGNDAQIGYDADGDGNIGTGEINSTAADARTPNGFQPYNSFAINGLSSGADFDGVTHDDADYRTTGATNSSYFNNFITPVQRRDTFSEYVMEMCLKPMVSACGPGDWVVGYDLDGDGDYNDTEREITLADLPSTLLDEEAIDAFDATQFDPSRLMAGTTAHPAKIADGQRFPRRVAFLRDTTNTNWIPVGISGVDDSAESDGAIECYLSSGSYNWNEGDDPDHACIVYSSSDRPRLQDNALWFQTNNGGNQNWGHDYPLWYDNPSNLTDNPLLVPVVQLDATTNTASGGATSAPTGGTRADQGTSWIAPAAGDTTFNFVVATGDNPSRPLPTNANIGEFNGGLPNLVRLLENWRDDELKILGSFIQAKRSEYATGPYFAWLTSAPKAFGGNNRYNIDSTGGKTPNFSQPERKWGFDVGLLSQSPDLFTSKLTNAPSEDEPDEFFREVNRNDKWIQTLLCAKETDSVPDPNDSTAPPIVTTTNAVGDPDPDSDKDSPRPSSFCKANTED